MGSVGHGGGDGRGSGDGGGTFSPCSDGTATAGSTWRECAVRSPRSKRPLREGREACTVRVYAYAHAYAYAYACTSWLLACQ